MTLTLQEALNSLPTDPDEIAARLVQEGIRGKRGSCIHCPIAHFIKKITVSRLARANGVCVSRVGRGDPKTATREMIITPHKIKMFIKNFDSGQYPQLEVCR